MTSQPITERTPETERRPRMRRGIKKRGILPSFGDIILPVVSVAAIALLVIAGRQFFINGLRTSPEIKSTKAYADAPALVAERLKDKEEEQPSVTVVNEEAPVNDGANMVIAAEVVPSIVANQPVKVEAPAPKKAEPVKAAAPAPKKTESNHYRGKLALYVTVTPDGSDIPPLEYNLFRRAEGQEIVLADMLKGCGVEQLFQGAEDIVIGPLRHGIYLLNQSDCTITKRGEILLKGKQVDLYYDEKVHIAFSDEKSEMVMIYKSLKPNERG